MRFNTSTILRLIVSLALILSTIEASSDNKKNNGVKGHKQKFLRAEAEINRRYLAKDGGRHFGGGGESCAAVGEECSRKNDCCSKDCSDNLCTDGNNDEPPPEETTPPPSPSGECDSTYCQTIVCPQGCANCDQMVCTTSDTNCGCAEGYTFSYCAAYGRQCL